MSEFARDAMYIHDLRTFSVIAHLIIIFGEVAQLVEHKLKN